VKSVVKKQNYGHKTATETNEQREQRPNRFGLCRVAIEEDDSQPDGIDRRLRGSGIEGKYVVLNM